MQAQINEALGRVAGLMKFDIAALSLFTGPGPKGSVAQLWKAEGVPEIPEGLTERDFPWMARELFSGRDVSVSSLNQLPAAAAIDCATYQRYQIRSTHNVPITAGGQVIGVLGLCSVFQERDLSQDMLQAQRLLGEVFANALNRQRADTALRESESRFRNMADSAPVMIWMSGTDKLCEYFNKQWLDFTGRSLEQELGNGWSEGVHPDDLHRCIEIYETSFVARQAFTMEYRLRRFDGQYGAILDHGVPRFEEDGTFLGYIGSCMDVTERKRTEIELQRNREELTHVARVSTMSELTASVAHELNQPLGAILSNAEAAELFLRAEPPALDDVRDILADIRKDDERAGEIIRRMRSLLRKHEVVLRPIEINAVVKDVFGLLGIEAAARRVSTNFELGEGLPNVAADRVHVQQVIMNLVVNAFDAMAVLPAEQRKLILRTETYDGVVQVAVSDSGPGVADETLAKVFEPFFTTKSKGMGMGLSIARTIVEAHKGKIWAENNAGGGASFCFTLPVATDR
jgi:PAS domain S-box-containing protein